MIKGNKKIELTAEEILSKVSEYVLYRHYFGEFTLNQATYNHLRGEDTHGTPSFIISNRYGHLHHKDFASDSWSGGCFHLVQQIYNCSYNEALEHIDQDLGLGILPHHNSGLYRQIKKQIKQPEELGKRYSLIQVVTRKFTEKDLSYWKGYNISAAILKQNNIYSIKEAYVDRKKISINSDELAFGYLFNKSYWKLYFCEREKKYKWISNVPLSLAYGLENLNPEFNTLICKSLKDYMVCKQIYEHTCCVQNESKAAFSEETVKYIKQNSKEVYYGGDSDEPGKKASYEITRAFGFKHINPPDNLLCEYNAKDFADWVRCEGKDAVKHHFKVKKLME